ncbi:MAG: type II toxin-antitoxin system VapC family toxin [Kiritimatiellia bacterium]
MNYLLDTCVISELIKHKAEHRVLAWIDSVPEDRLYLSVLTLGELHKGIARLDAGDRRHRLEKWLSDDVRARFEDRIVTLDEDALVLWGRIMGEGTCHGRTWPVMDSLMAASAIAWHMTLVTRNLADVQAMGVTLFDPWQTES